MGGIMSARDGKITVVNDTEDDLIYLNDRVHSGKLDSYPKEICSGARGVIKVGSKASKGARGTVRFVSETHSRLYRVYFNHPFGNKTTTYKISYHPRGISASGKQHPKGHDSETTLKLKGAEENVAPTLDELSTRLMYNWVWDDKKKDDKYTAIKWHEQAYDANYRMYKPSIREGTGEFIISTKFDHIRGSAQDDHAIMTFRIDSTSGLMTDIDYEFAYNGYEPVEINVPNSDANPKAALADAAQQVGQAILDKLGKHDHGGRLGFPDLVEGETEEMIAIIGKLFP